MTEPTLGAILSGARLRAGWSLRDAERETGVPNAHISQLETGVIAAPGIVVLVKLAKGYGLPVRTLLEAAGGQGHDWALVMEASEAEIRADERKRLAGELERHPSALVTGRAPDAYESAAAVTMAEIAHLLREDLPDLERTDG